MKLKPEHAQALKTAIGQVNELIDHVNEARETLHKAQTSRKSPYHGADQYETRLQAIVTLLFSIKDNMEIEASGLDRHTWMWVADNLKEGEDQVETYNTLCKHQSN